MVAGAGAGAGRRVGNGNCRFIDVKDEAPRREIFRRFRVLRDPAIQVALQSRHVFWLRRPADGGHIRCRD